MPQPALAATSTIRTESDVCLVAAYPALPLPETLGEATALSPATTPAPLLRRWRIGDLADSVCSALRWRPASWWPHYAEWLAKYSGDKSAIPDAGHKRPESNVLGIETRGRAAGFGHFSACLAIRSRFSANRPDS